MINATDVAFICGDMEHAPSCIWSGGAQVCIVDQGGNRWTDETCTVPWVSPECACGYFARRELAIQRLRAFVATQPDPAGAG